MSRKTIIIISLCFILLLSACSAADSGASDPQPAATPAGNDKQSAAESAGGDKQTTPAPAESEKQSTASETASDSTLTLKGLKEAVEKLGYEVRPIEEIQLMGDPKPADGFNVHYVDENSDSFRPVLEFSSPADALKYAEDVNKSGYSLCIVNGRFLTAISAEYGVVMNDAEAAFFAKLLRSEVMAAPKTSDTPVISKASDYASAVKQVSALRKALNTLVNNTVLTHDKSAPADKNFSAEFISFNMINSGNLEFTGYLSEDEAGRDAITQIWTALGVTDMKAERTAAHTYKLTGIRAGMTTPFLIRCAFDPSSGSLQLMENDGDRVIELIEFVPISGDTYAFQTNFERAIVTYRDGKITAFTYSLLKSAETEGYDPDADGIYTKDGFDEAWVKSAGEDLYEQLITYDGTVLKIYAESFFTGNRVSADISVP